MFFAWMPMLMPLISTNKYIILMRPELSSAITFLTVPVHQRQHQTLMPTAINRFGVVVNFVWGILQIQAMTEVQSAGKFIVTLSKMLISDLCICVEVPG